MDVQLDNHPLSSTGRSHQQLLTEMDSAYDDYFEAARGLESLLRRGVVWTELGPAVDVVEIRFEKIRQLAAKLLKFHRKNLEESLANAQRDLNVVRGLLSGALAALLALGALLGLVVWRDTIRPLRLKLVESERIIARQEKLASLGVLAAGVAHEIRNPLTAIKARLFTQRKQLAPGSAAAMDAELISYEIQQLERIVSEFLAFARPGQPEFSEVTAASLLNSIRDLMQPQLEEQEVLLTVSPPPDLHVRVDPSQLRQVLINLVRNAAEAMGRRGTVQLRARSSVQRIRNVLTLSVILEVADSGPGIPPEIQERLFDPFFTTKENGTGLGLAIALRIIEKHNGSLEFHTHPGRGTVFRVVLPLVTPTAESDTGESLRSDRPLASAT